MKWMLREKNRCNAADDATVKSDNKVCSRRKQCVIPGETSEGGKVPEQIRL